MRKKRDKNTAGLAEHRYFQHANRMITPITHLLGMSCVALVAAFFLPVWAGCPWGSPAHANAMLELSVVFLSMLVIILALVIMDKRLS